MSFTALVRSTREGNVFTLSVRPQGMRDGGTLTLPSPPLPPQAGPGQDTPALPLPLHQPGPGQRTPHLYPLGRKCQWQDTAQAVRLLHFHAGGLSCLHITFNTHFSENNNPTMPGTTIPIRQLRRHVLRSFLAISVHFSYSRIIVPDDSFSRPLSIEH